MKYSKHFSTKQTLQMEPIPGKDMVPNDEGGYVFAVDKWDILQRFLHIGTEGGTFYAQEGKLTKESAETVVECIREDGKRVVTEAVEISVKGTAPKNDPAIFVLALACTFGSPGTKRAAYDSITRICRIGTHIFQFCQAIQDLRGWSRGLRNGVGRFYQGATDEQLALQLIKYRQRGGWTHRDVLRLAHPKPMNPVQEILFRLTVGKSDLFDEKAENANMIPGIYEAYATATEILKWGQEENDGLIRKYNLPRECIPTEHLNQPDVWEALLEKMPMTAMIRNLPKMTSVGLLKTNYDNAVQEVCKRLIDVQQLRKARIHPINVLVALKTYASGKGVRGKLSWSPVGAIVDALDEAFYASFQNVEATGKRFLVAIDLSGSMWGTPVIGTPALQATEAAAAFAMMVARTEPKYTILVYESWDETQILPITPKCRLDDVMRLMKQVTSQNGTDCAAPMIFAKISRIPIDIFLLLTDAQTWAGDTHPIQALNEYRRKMGIPAKLLEACMAMNSYSIADIDDPGCMRTIGFSAALPEVIRWFATNE